MKYYIIIFCCLSCVSLPAQQSGNPPFFIRYHYNDSIITIPKQPLKAAFETVGLNMDVWAFDRYVIDGEYAYISWETMKSNIRNGFVWNNYQFSTNLFAHPYHGGLYFNTVRSNGMNFWQQLFLRCGD